MLTLTNAATDETPRRPVALGTLIMFSWLCGLLWGTGWVLLMTAFIGAVVKAALAMGGPSEPSLSLCLIGPSLVFGAPVLLGYGLTRSKHGVISGLLGAPAGIVGWLAVGWLLRALIGLIGSRVVAAQGPAGFIALLIAVSAAAVMVPITGRSSAKGPAHSARGFLLGLSIGLGLSLLMALALSDSVLGGSNVLHLVWQIPPVIWATVVYFSQSTGNRGNWRAFLVWLALMLVTSTLPFLVIKLLPTWWQS